ncbi:MAG: phosphatase PAP2 family protein [Cyclobacteriaceae bacterium]|nr:phosphatase PAP2 family protein [Cyclobacteriaceae bacterium]
MLDLLDQFDKQLFLHFNSGHSSLSDQIWQSITYSPTWTPLYGLLLFFMVKTFKQDSIFIVAGILLVILACDQFTSSFMKPYFGRLRPCYDVSIGHLVNVVDGCGGRYGFASGHSANSFGIAMFGWFTFRRYWRGTWLLFVWASLVAFSRIMVGVHYPGDILAGAVVGLTFGWIIFKLTEKFTSKCGWSRL